MGWRFRPHRLVPCGLLLGLLAGCRGEPKVLDPRSPPPRERPPIALPATQVPPSHSRVVLHSIDGPMNIAVRADTTFIPPGYDVPPTRTGDLCTTPCIADLPVGRYKLYMTGEGPDHQIGDTDVVTLTEGVTYYVRAPGRTEPRTWFPVVPGLIMVGATILVVSGLTLAASASDSDESFDTSGDATPGFVLAGAGVALGIGGGIWAYDQSRGSRQEGASTVWTEPQ